MPRFDGLETQTLVDPVTGRTGLQPRPGRPRRQAIGHRPRRYRGPIPAAPLCGWGRDVEDPNEGAEGDADARGDRVAARLAQVASHPGQAQRAGRDHLPERLLTGFEPRRGHRDMTPGLVWMQLPDLQPGSALGAAEHGRVLHDHERVAVFLPDHAAPRGEFGEGGAIARTQLKTARQPGTRDRVKQRGDRGPIRIGPLGPHAVKAGSGTPETPPVTPPSRSTQPSAKAGSRCSHLPARAEAAMPAPAAISAPYRAAH